jgi:hypothetical protein
MDAPFDTLKYLVLLGVGWFLLFQQNAVLDDREFILPENSNVLQRIEIDSSGHVYPYTATAVTFSCLLVVLVVIIVCGVQLGVIHDVLDRSTQVGATKHMRTE